MTITLITSNLHFKIQRITDNGLLTLSYAKELKSLNLNECDRITPRGFRHLTRLRNLTTLSINSTSMNDEVLKVSQIVLQSINWEETLHFNLKSCENDLFIKFADHNMNQRSNLGSSANTRPFLQTCDWYTIKELWFWTKLKWLFSFLN